MLAKYAGYPQDLINLSPDLALIASYAEVAAGRGSLDENLHNAFAVDCNPGDLHTTIAGIEETRLYVTTNYDDLLEKALAPRQPHLIIDRGGTRGLWVTPNGKPPQQVKETGQDIDELLNDERTGAPSGPIIFKIHGSVNKDHADEDGYLITEEDYVDFLAVTAAATFRPISTH